MFRRTNFSKLFFVLPFVLFLALRLTNVSNDMSNTDAYRWHLRSQSFSKALLNRDFANTYQSYHPGVTLMWLSSGVEWGIKAFNKFTHTEFKTIGNVEGYALIDGASKTVLVFVAFLLLILQYRYISKIFDQKTGLLFVFLCAIEPYFIGINRWYHLTSLEVGFTFLSFLSFILWFKFADTKYTFKSGIFFGLALLTKFSSVFLLPVLALIFVVNMLKKHVTEKNFYSKSFLIFELSAIGVFILLFPAIWATPIQVLVKMFGAALKSGAGNYITVSFAEQKPGLYYLFVLLFKLSPITVILFIVSSVKVVKWKEFPIFFTTMYIVFQLILLSASEQKVERYILVLFPAILLLCAVMLSKASKGFLCLAITAGIVSTFMAVKTLYPYYSAYYSPLMGGPHAAFIMNLYDDSGEYFAQAARLLNLQGRNTHVYVPFDNISFAPYFKGKLDLSITAETNYVVYSRDSRRSSDADFIGCAKVFKNILNSDFPVVTIFSCNFRELQ